MPSTTLQPGSTDTASVKALQQYLVQLGYMSQSQMDTGPGIYGPQTTRAVANMQKDLGVDNSTGVGYFGPRTIAALKANPRVTSGGSQTPATPAPDMAAAVAAAIAANPDVKQFGGNNSPDDILNAYTTGDWSGVVSLSGKPFTDEQQKAAVAQAEAALAPAYKAQESNDRATTEDALRGTQEDFGDFQNSESKNFGTDKRNLDQNSADQGILFSGSRVQKLNDLRNTYADREAIKRRTASENLTSTARGYQYAYGNDAARSLSDRYNLGGTTSFNSLTGGASRGGLSAAYNPSSSDFQGTAPVAQKTAVQTRAATLLANKANKLSLSGIGSKF